MAPVIETNNIAFRYTPKGEVIFSGVNLSVMAGEVFFLIGPNGTGKSTLLKCLSGLLPVDAGSVTLNGQNIRRLTPRTVARQVGYVPQALVSAFPFMVRDIVVMGRASRMGLLASPGETDMMRAKQAMERVGILSLANRRCHQISGGEWQLVLIARALTQSPGILLLDEPTSHLDLGNQIKTLEVISQLAADGLTIVMASHFPDHAFLNASHVAILKDGAIRNIGTPEAVITEDNLKSIYGVDVRVQYIGNGINRTVCIPKLTGPQLTE